MKVEVADMVQTLAPPTTTKPHEGLIQNGKRVLALVVMAGLLVVVMFLSVFIGSGDIPVSDVWQAILHGRDGSTNAEIILSNRIPRTLLGVLVGAALGVAGALIQALTRNPLADPGILGVNAGAYFVMVVGFAVFGATSISGNVLFAMLGAFAASILVYFVGSRGRGGASPAKLVLTGVAVSCVFQGVAFGITMVDPKAFDNIRNWQVGSLQKDQTDSILDTIWPYILVGLVIALLLTAYLNAIALGDDRARALGVPVTSVRGAGFVSMTLLCGAGTAAVGPITFLGLMVPHAVRTVVGPDQKWIIPASMLFAPVLFLGADVIGRVIAPTEVPVGMVVAFIGAPVLIYLARHSKFNEL
ncbi:iron chelate uptake ABC transporter family permease subunit [Nocardia sp. 348MFTsu5.1]|uniref:iron chelate uptake ABC transporter family permease subunit n=1 Tax=Nocardia sp. 348MFTsu5.1 TaxID=1172185 RepID=UPI00037144B2|nr:iron chelate uptake ABC transporter family permease subunit [Nocardia sp. 348MFTsu5.1]